FPAAPHALPLVGRVRSGRARPLRQPARYQRLPGSAFAGFFPPTSACCCRRLEIATAVPLRDGEEIATDEVALPARCGTFCGNITANVPAPRPRPHARCPFRPAPRGRRPGDGPRG